MIGYILNHNKMNINDNDARDVYHLCKPLVHCDIVTMDKRWKTFIDQNFPFYSDKIISNKGGKGINQIIDKIKLLK